MASIERTAYPRFQKRMSAEELRARYELTDAEQQFVSANANGGRQRVTLACLLKTRQQLGYFPALTEVPVQTAGLCRPDLPAGPYPPETENVRQVLLSQGGAESLQEQYEAVAAYHQNNYRPLLWPVHVGYRAVLFRLLDLLAIGSASQDTALMDALAFVKEHRHSRKDTLPHEIDLGFAGQRWQTFIETEQDGETVLIRRALEVCVFIHLAEALHRLDVYVEGSEGYADYRRQLLPGEEWRQRLPAYCEAAGLPADGKAFVAGLKQQLTELSREVDAGFPDNAELTLSANGKPRLKQLQKLPLPDGLARTSHRGRRI